MKNRFVFLLIMSTTWACVFISEPDVGASTEFDFSPEDHVAPTSGSSHMGNDEGVVTGLSPDRACQSNHQPNCPPADAGTDEQNLNSYQNIPTPEVDESVRTHQSATHDIAFVFPEEDDSTETHEENCLAHEEDDEDEDEVEDEDERDEADGSNDCGMIEVDNEP